MQMQGQLDEYRDAFLFVDTGTPGWQILHLNQAAIDRLGETSSSPDQKQSVSAAWLTGAGRCRAGVPSASVRGRPFWDLFCAFDETSLSKVLLPTVSWHQRQHFAEQGVARTGGACAGVICDAV